MTHRLLPIMLCLAMTLNTRAQYTRGTLDSFFSALARNQQFNGNVLIAENGRIIYERSFGYADLASRKPNEKGTTFPVASITKTFTGTAILQLFEKGKLDLNAPVTEYLPGFPYPDITIRHLLSHTSGLQPYDRFFESERALHPDTVFTNKDFLGRYAALKLPLYYQPGDDSNYDNANFIFLALIVEKLSGMPYQEYVKENIFKPAGMTKTFFPKRAFYHYTAEEKKGMADTYRYPHPYSSTLERTDTIGFVSSYWHVYNFQGFGEIVSTAGDLLKYDQAFYKGLLLKSSTMSMAYRPVPLNNGQPNPGNRNRNSFGLGWIIETDSTHGRIVRGSGGAIGMRSSLFRNITKHQTIILLDNTQNETDDIGRALVRLMNGERVKPRGRSAARQYGNTLVKDGSPAAALQLEKIRSDSAHYDISEDEFNTLGYDLFSGGMKKEALETFRVNATMFPGSWNVYDSYGEALLDAGRKEEAIRMYEKSMELNPGNENGRKVLETLRKQ